MENSASPTSTDSSSDSQLSPAALDEASASYVGKWNDLVSTTNWEKGRIIFEWREALVEAEAGVQEYSDEAWAQRVGGVTAQHVGRLRRVFQRFGEVFQQYNGLYWSHFQAGLDWEDAEMWLEGAVQNGWSVSGMRRQRWETLDGDESNRPRPEDVISGELDEDFLPDTESQDDSEAGVADRQPRSVPEGPLEEGPDFGDESQEDSMGAADVPEAATATVEAVRPFEELAELPEDLLDAFESFKLAILRHKSEEWAEVSREDLLASLDALKELAIAP